MQELSTSYTFANINFPRRTGLIKWLRYLSFVVNDIILLASLSTLFFWTTNISGIGDFLFQKLTISPFTPILFIFSGISLLFGAKRHVISEQQNTEKEEHFWWNPVVPICFATITAVLGFVNVLVPTNKGFLSLSPYEGFCFLLIGLALIPPFTRILHRFHITQLLLFIVSSVNVFIVLENIYQLFSPLSIQQILPVSLPLALSFALFCFGVIIRWTNRGFFGNFTLNSTLSTFAFRLFLINLISAPLIAFMALFVMHKTPYNIYQVLTILVVLFAFISSTILWINVKLLYRYDLEHLIMRESLRIHNIDLTTEKEQIRKRMTQLEQDKQQYIDKLNTQKAWQNAVDTIG